MTRAQTAADPTQLALAYGDGSKFDARRRLYAHVRPRRDFLGWALGHLDVAPDALVLDVGCGPGHYLAALARRERSVLAVGVDLSAGMVYEARHASGDRAVAVASVAALPFGEGVFDAVLAMHMLYHAPDVDRALVELRRVLRPDGVLLASTVSGEHLTKLRALMDATAGERLPRSSDRFNLESGLDQLGAVFDDVAVDVLSGTVVLDDPAPAVAFVESARDLHEPVLPTGVAWDAVVAHTRAELERELARTGAIELAARSGVFVCR